MHYNPIFICLVAVTLCFAGRRTDERLSSKQGLAFSTDENSDRLIRALKICDQSLDDAVILATKYINQSNTLLPPEFPESCKELIELVEELLENRRTINPRYYQQGMDQVPMNRAPRTRAISSTLYGLTRGCPQVYSTPKRSYRREICEANVCPAKGLEKTCKSKNLQPTATQTCKMCYPTPNAKLITEHCQARWQRERKAFYIVCFVLMGLTLVSGVLLHIRRYCVRKRKLQAEDETAAKQSGEIYHYDGASSSISFGPDDSEPESSNAERDVDEENEAHDIWDEGDGDIGSATAQRKWKQLGILSKTGRKRIQDLFDLEAMRSRREVGGNPQQRHSGDKIPVMPRAPNATVRPVEREHRRGRSERRLPESSNASAVELQVMRKSGTA
ncbi:hypothetical protein BGW36DRAFT_427422 [Talaromyces proteolyticus]|uniref:Uncharacterized protein n=1 Tax=Talaromyces proteolyticus TaxID=1131652 RepID=A0AAD4KV74_9EURO|nr:uncharacterized protein BGW36DRAFT_427422 [Talaromyces proteolyticus]KAH8697461.1 hypothetical protein BGW36DRAFT_427422 [Talaromyces proteolyticus]